MRGHVTSSVAACTAEQTGLIMYGVVLVPRRVIRWWCRVAHSCPDSAMFGNSCTGSDRPWSERRRIHPPHLRCPPCRAATVRSPRRRVARAKSRTYPWSGIPRDVCRWRAKASFIQAAFATRGNPGAGRNLVRTPYVIGGARWDPRDCARRATRRNPGPHGSGGARA